MQSSAVMIRGCLKPVWSACWRCLIIFAVCILTAAPAAAQKGGKPKGMKPGQGTLQGGNRGNKGSKDVLLSESLPPSFRGLSNDEVQTLTVIAKEARSWIDTGALSQDTLVLTPASFSEALTLSAETESPSVDTERSGLAVLARLEPDQRKALGELVDATVEDQAASAAFESLFREQLMGLREIASLQKTRSLEAGWKKEATETGRRLGKALIRESRVFADVARAISKEQRDAILLICRTGIIPADEEPQLQSANAELSASDPEVRRAMTQLAWRYSLWLSGGQRPPRVLSEEEQREQRKKNEVADPGLTSLLVLLTEVQHQELLQVLKARVNSEHQQSRLQQSIGQSLQQLQTSRSLDERRVEQQVIQFVQTGVLSNSSTISSFETIRRSLSDAQREYLGGDPPSADPSDKKKR